MNLVGESSSGVRVVIIKIYPMRPYLWLAVPKSKKTRVGWLVMKHPPLKAALVIVLWTVFTGAVYMTIIEIIAWMIKIIHMLFLVSYSVSIF